MSRPGAPLRLASRSPRRRTLLARAGIPFRVGPLPPAAERAPAGATPRARVLWLARKKARAVAARVPGEWVLGADTLVFLGRRPLGKPRDAKAARRMLAALSGRRHRVLTAVVLARASGRSVRCLAGVAAATVEFRRLSAAEVRAYVASGEPLDKAGGYALQGRGGAFVGRLWGAPDTVVGLPLGLLGRLLARAGMRGAHAPVKPARRRGR